MAAQPLPSQHCLVFLRKQCHKLLPITLTAPQNLFLASPWPFLQQHGIEKGFSIGQPSERTSGDLRLPPSVHMISKEIPPMHSPLHKFAFVWRFSLLSLNDKH